MIFKNVRVEVEKRLRWRTSVPCTKILWLALLVRFSPVVWLPSFIKLKWRLQLEVEMSEIDIIMREWMENLLIWTKVSLGVCWVPKLVKIAGTLPAVQAASASFICRTNSCQAFNWGWTLKSSKERRLQGCSNQCGVQSLAWPPKLFQAVLLTPLEGFLVKNISYKW